MPKKDYTEVLKRIRDRWDYGVQRMRYNVEQGDEDMRTLSVDGNWPETERKARKEAQRPMGHTDIASPNNDRVVNQFNMNSRGIKVVQKGSSATENSAELRESRIREIEYENDAPAVYGAMLQNAVDRGWGIFKIYTEEQNANSFDQRICMEPILNVKSVVFDPDTRKRDRSDMKWLFHVDKEYEMEEFAEEFPDAEARSFNEEMRKSAPSWLRGNQKIMVAQYYEVERTKTRKLLLEGEESSVLEMNLPEGAKIKGDSVVYADGSTKTITRNSKTSVSKVMIYLTNGIEILEEPVPWVGTTIPFPICTGREKFQELLGEGGWGAGEQLVIESMTRKMRHPSMMYDFADAAEREAMGLVIHAKLLTAEGQVEDFEEWKDPFRTNRVNLRYKGVIDGVPVAPPIHIQNEPDISPFEVIKQSYLRAGQNAIGMSSTDQKDRISKSGVAQQRIDQAGDIASFHYINSANRAIKYGLQIINEILDKVEDTSRTVGVREADGTYEKRDLQVMQKEDGTVESPYGLPEDHGFNIETGPSYQSQTDKADDFLESFRKEAPELIPLWADLDVLNAKIGPMGEQIAERVKPQSVRQQEEAEKNGQQPIPPQVKQQMAAMQEHMKQILAEYKKLAMERDAKVVETNAKKEIELGKAAYQTKLAMFNKYYDFKIAMLKVNAQAASDAEYIENDQKIAAEEHALDFDLAQLSHLQAKELTGLDQSHAIETQQMDQAHQAGMQDQQLTSQEEEAERAREAAMAAEPTE